VSLNYRYARTAVQPPIGWGRTELQGAVVESMKVPKEALALEHIYGYRTDMPGTNLSAAGGGKFLVWSVASVAVVLDLAEGYVLVILRGALLALLALLAWPPSSSLFCVALLAWHLPP